jgi:hypothetical protein
MILCLKNGGALVKKDPKRWEGNGSPTEKTKSWLLHCILRNDKWSVGKDAGNQFSWQWFTLLQIASFMAKSLAGDVAPWKSFYWACTGPWIDSSAAQTKQSHRQTWKTHIHLFYSNPLLKNNQEPRHGDWWQNPKSYSVHFGQNWSESSQPCELLPHCGFHLFSFVQNKTE